VFQVLQVEPIAGQMRRSAAPGGSQNSSHSTAPEQCMKVGRMGHAALAKNCKNAPDAQTRYRGTHTLTDHECGRRLRVQMVRPGSPLQPEGGALCKRVVHLWANL
jgi:hypothetical protein